MSIFKDVRILSELLLLKERGALSARDYSSLTEEYQPMSPYLVNLVKAKALTIERLRGGRVRKPTILQRLGLRGNKVYRKLT